MGWSNSSHKKTVEDIGRLISDLEKSGLEVNFKWTPEHAHADIRGNCIADELAKEDAEEAIAEDSQILTGVDFKKFARVPCLGSRHVYNYKPTVSLKTPAYMFVAFIVEKRQSLS